MARSITRTAISARRSSLRQGAHADAWPARANLSGRLGRRAFQSIYPSAPNGFWSLAMWPEWYLIIIALAAISALGILWGPLLLALPLLALAVGASFIQAGLSVAQASSTMASLQDRVTVVKSHTLTAILHLLQPLARLHGRLRSGTDPWRRRGAQPGGALAADPHHLERTLAGFREAAVGRGPLGIWSHRPPRRRLR